MDSVLREKAVKLRTERELSYSEIKKRLGVSKSTLSYWLKDFPLSEEKIVQLKRLGWKKGEASRERFRNTMAGKRKKLDLEAYKKWCREIKSLDDSHLLIAGLMLYWAEGDKRNATRIGLANTDIDVIEIFVRWVEKFFGVLREQIKIQLHLYEGMNLESEMRFWSKGLGIDREQFYKPEIRKLRKSSFTYKESFRHGTCSVYVMGVQLKRDVAMASKAIIDMMKIKYTGV